MVNIACALGQARLTLRMSNVLSAGLLRAGVGSLTV